MVRLLVVVVVVLLTACGRFGFDSGDPGDDGVETDAPALPLDGPATVIPAICNKRTLGTVPTAANAAVVVRATALASGGYAVSIGTVSGAIHVVRVLPDGSFASLHTPMTAGYQLYGASAVGDRVFLYAATGGSAYVKALDVSDLLSEATMLALRQHHWPGNVRELRNLIEATLAMGEAPVLARDASPVSAGDPFTPLLGLDYKAARHQILSEFEVRYCSALIESAGGNVSRAARQAQMDRSHLLELLQRHRLK